MGALDRFTLEYADRQGVQASGLQIITIEVGQFSLRGSEYSEFPSLLIPGIPRVPEARAEIRKIFHSWPIPELL